MSQPIDPLDLDPSRLSAELDDPYAPADVSETPVRMRVVATRSLTNSPSCVPDSDAPTRKVVRPIRRRHDVRVDAWAVPAPANWSRSPRVILKVASGGRRSTARLSGERGRRQSSPSPSSDWALPF